jgi:BioD-like phosphotransacetylase family protein
VHKLVFASTRRGAGKTSAIVGMLEAARPSFGYMKPFGDRLLYRKKRLWDYDAALVTDLFGLKESPEDISISHQHSKIRYMYDRDMTKGKLLEMVTRVGAGKDLVVIEAGRDLSYGVSVHLDALTVARWTEGDLVVVASGDENTVVDDIAFMRRYVDTSGSRLKGVIVNKVPDVEDFKATYLDKVIALDVPVLGVLPHTPELTYINVTHLVEWLFAKVVAGSSGLNDVIQNIFVGAMSGDAAVQNPLWERPAKLIITSGDRTDIVLAALESDTRAVVLTNNILPPPQVIAKADDRGIPLLLVAQDTFQTAQKVDAIEPLLTKDDAERVAAVGRLVERHVDVGALVGE